MNLRKFHVTLNVEDSVDGEGELAGVALGDPVAPLEIMFLHAAGLNGVAYQSILQPLSSGAHVAAVDMRGHGLTMLPKQANQLRSLDKLRDDVIAAVQKTAPNGLVLAGHGMGGTIALLVAARAPHLVNGLVLADPIIRTPEFYKYAHLPFIGRLTSMSREARAAANRKRARFASREEAFEALQKEIPYKSWRTPFLQDYLTDGLTWVADQNFELSCEPRWESACIAAQAVRPWWAFAQIGKYRERLLAFQRKLSKLPEEERHAQLAEHDRKLQSGEMRRGQVAKNIPIIVLQAEHGSASLDDLDRRIHTVMPDAAVTRVPGTTHYLPMERPYVVRDAIDILHRSWRGEFESDYIGAVKRTINDSIGIMG